MLNVLSLFDGISCARVALNRLGIDCKYYASEVDKYAINIAQKNFPDTIQLGDVRNITADMFSEPIDLLIGGSPCQDLSIAKNNRRGLDGERSGLFWEYVRIWKELKPRYFVLENVNSMPKEARQIISKTMGVQPIMINASLVSAQSRKRLFWTNIEQDALGNCNIPLPEDRHVYLNSILVDGIAPKEKSHCLHLGCGFTAKNIGKGFETPIRIGSYNSGGQGDRVYSVNGKSVSLSANGGGRGAKTGLYIVDHYNKTIRADGKAKTLGTNPQCETAIAGQSVTDGCIIRKLTPVECERLQSLPDNYTEGISNTQRYKCLGNAFNVEVVKHILSYMQIF